MIDMQTFADTQTAANNQTLTDALMQSTDLQPAELLHSTYVSGHVNDQRITCAWGHVND